MKNLLLLLAVFIIAVLSNAPVSQALEVYSDNVDASLVETESEAAVAHEAAVAEDVSFDVERHHRHRHRRRGLRRLARKLRRGGRKIHRKIHKHAHKAHRHHRRKAHRRHRRKHSKKHRRHRRKAHRRHRRKHSKKHRRHRRKAHRRHRRKHSKKHRRHRRKHSKKHARRRALRAKLARRRRALKARRARARRAHKHRHHRRSLKARRLRAKIARARRALKARRARARRARKHRRHHKRHAKRHHKRHHKHHGKRHHKRHHKHHGKRHHKRHHKHHGKRHHKRHHKHHAHKRGSFRPKHKKFGGDNGKLSKTLQKVVTTQPESAVVKVGKHWAFENSVLRKLNKYVKGTPKELINREQLIEKETHNVCGMVANHCGSTNPKAMTNTRTCVLTKNACFKYKIALEKVRRAKKQCETAHKMKLRDDFMGKLDAQVEVAKCVRYVKSVDHYLKSGGKKFAAARVAEVLDTDATKARTKVDDASQELKKLKAEEKRFAPAYKACKKWADKSKDCNDRGDFGSADCAAARAKSSKCEAAGDIEYYTEAHAKVKAHQDSITDLKGERDTAEATALKGGKK